MKRVAIKQSEAEQLLRDALWCVQKFRSNVADELGETGVKLIDTLYPWVNQLMPMLVKLTDRIDNGGQLAPMEFYNAMFIIHRWTEPLNMLYAIRTDGKTFPEPAREWLLGWEPE